MLKEVSFLFSKGRNIMKDEKKNLQHYSSFLLRLAWTVEIIAVLIGFTISVLMAITAAGTAFNGQNLELSTTISAIIISSLPFLLVAVVELCKIPLVFAFMYSKNYIWKMIFLFFVLFLCVITFETMLNGFERNFSNLNKAIDIRKNNIININTQIELVEKKKAYVQVLTEEELMKDLSDRTAASENIMKRKAQQANRNKLAQLKSIRTDFENEIQNKIDTLRNKRDQYYNDWAREKENVENRFSTTVGSNISGSREERTRLIDELEELKNEMKKEIANSNFFTEATIKRKYRVLIKDKEKQLSTITAGYLGGDAIEKQSLMENQLRQQVTFVNSKYEGRIKEIDKRISDLKKEIEDINIKNQAVRKRIMNSAKNQVNNAYKIHLEEKQKISEYEAENLVKLEEINQKVFKFDESIFDLKNEQRLINSEINYLINQNQVYRLAMYVSGKEDAKYLDKQMVGIVAVVWFGSLALIAAVTGMMLAIASFYLGKLLKDIEENESLTTADNEPKLPTIYDEDSR